MLKTKAVILAKVETTYGTDAVPTAALNAILCSDPTIEPISSKLERNNIKPVFGSNRFAVVGEGMKLSFGVELRHNGTSGGSITANDISTLLRGCNFTQVITTTTGQEKVTCTPNSTQDSESLTLYYYLDGIQHKVLGARGSWSLDGKVNDYGKIRFDFTGIYAGPTDVALPTPTLNYLTSPVLKNAAFAIDGYAACVDGISISCNSDIVPRRCVNAATGVMGWYAKERAVTGQIAPEMVTVATKNYWAMWESGSAYALTMTWGSVAGNRCTITAPAVQLEAPKYGDRNNIVTAELPLVFCPTTAGNDEISIVFS